MRKPGLLSFVVIAFTAVLVACSTRAVATPEQPGATPPMPSSTASPSALPTATHPSPALKQTKTHSPPTPSPTPSPTRGDCSSRGGMIVQASLESQLVPQPLDYRIYLPPCYSEGIDRHYPVLYLIHGQGYTDDQWERLGVGEAANALIASQEIAPFLIVMPRDRVWRQPDVDRFGDAVVQELIPWVDAHYRTLPDRSFRAIGGLSRGASWALHLGLVHWELFGTIGSHSLAVFLGDTPYIMDWLDAIPTEQMPRFYLDIGDQERKATMESAVWFEKLLTDQGIPHEWYLFPGDHEEKYWGSHVEQYLRWYAQEW